MGCFDKLLLEFGGSYLKPGDGRALIVEQERMENEIKSRVGSPVYHMHGEEERLKREG